MKCQSCGYDGIPNLEVAGPHTKAICVKCGKYIKMVGKDELDHLKTQTNGRGLKVWTAQYNYKGLDRIDITVKSAIYPWNVFAPTWAMVMAYKNTGDESVYTEAYNKIIAGAFTLHEKELWELIHSDRTITLVCFCRPDDFCHRVLLAKHFEALGATYYGERR